ncbi:MAG: PEGA domain-containing protein [Rubripirellula sp.]
MPTFAHRSTPFLRHRYLLRVIAVLGLISLVMSAGCVRRRMTVRTNPPGATVSVDNQVIGTTPAATSFVYYGTRELRIEKDGYRTETVLRKINPPWYQLPGLDFISESLWPGEIRDERVIEVELVPKEMEKTDKVIDRADSLRSQSLTGMVTAPN